FGWAVLTSAALWAGSTAIGPGPGLLALAQSPADSQFPTARQASPQTTQASGPSNASSGVPGGSRAAPPVRKEDPKRSSVGKMLRELADRLDAENAPDAVDEQLR